MFRVARVVPVVVVAPQPWSPIDLLIRRFRPSFRPMAEPDEVMDGIEIYRPRFLSVPGMLKSLDGWMMAAGAMRICRRLKIDFDPTVVDAHFLYPDGYAATIVARRLGLPVMITIRGSKDEWLIGTSREPFLRMALERSKKLVAVSDSLKHSVAIRLGQPADKVVVIGNGVDVMRFSPVDRSSARRRLGIEDNARVLLSVGGLTENKGFHRVIPLLPELRRRLPGLTYLIVGGGTSKGDMRGELERLARQHGVDDVVRFLGPQSQDDLKWYYGAADLFVLATAFEGWANVFLEAMACGVPVVTTDVGGNREVVSRPELGMIVPFWNPDAFSQAIRNAFEHSWDREALRRYALENSWEDRVDRLVREFRALGASA